MGVGATLYIVPNLAQFIASEDSHNQIYPNRRLVNLVIFASPADVTHVTAAALLYPV
jgi:hypothetical protein